MTEAMKFTCRRWGESDTLHPGRPSGAESSACGAQDTVQDQEIQVSGEDRDVIAAGLLQIQQKLERHVKGVPDLDDSTANWITA